MPAPDQRGVTLIELAITLTIIALMVTIAVPSYQNFMERQRLIAAGEAIRDQLVFARSEAIKRGVPVFVNYSVGNSWAAAVGDAEACDPTASDATACSLPVAGTATYNVVRAAGYPDVTMPSAFDGGTVFEPRRGTASGGAGGLANGTVTLTSKNGYELRVRVSALGRISMCSPNLGGYAACS